MTRGCTALSVALVGLLSSAALAQPAMQRLAEVSGTQVILYTATPVALVRQQVRVHLTAGPSQVTFTWAKGKIDEASVRLLPPRGLSLGGLTRPAGTEKTLAWEVTAQAEGDYEVTVMYLLSDLKWSPSYRLVYTPGSAEVTLEGHLTLSNESGLAFEDTQVQVILGRPGSDSAPAAGSPAAFTLADLGALPLGSKLCARFLPPVSLPAQLVYRIDSERAPETVQRILLVQPPSSGALAQEALPRGALQVVLAEADQPTRPLLSTELSYEPGKEFEIALGAEPDVVVERRMLDQLKVNVEFDRLGRVSGFDTVEQYRIRVRNRRAEMAEIEVVESVLETWDFATRALHAREEGTATMHLSVPPGEERVLDFSLTKHSGTRIP